MENIIIIVTPILINVYLFGVEVKRGKKHSSDNFLFKILLNIKNYNKQASDTKISNIGAKSTFKVGIEKFSGGGGV